MAGRRGMVYQPWAIYDSLMLPLCAGWSYIWGRPIIANVCSKYEKKKKAKRQTI